MTMCGLTEHLKSITSKDFGVNIRKKSNLAFKSHEMLMQENGDQSSGRSDGAATRYGRGSGRCAGGRGGNVGYGRDGRPRLAAHY